MFAGTGYGSILTNPNISCRRQFSSGAAILLGRGPGSACLAVTSSRCVYPMHRASPCPATPQHVQILGVCSLAAAREKPAELGQWKCPLVNIFPSSAVSF